MTKEYYEQTVTITVSKESLAAYDAAGAKTYIRDAGQYYFTAARDAHEATKNILAKKASPPVETPRWSTTPIILTPSTPRLSRSRRQPTKRSPTNSSGTELSIHDAVVDGVAKDFDDEIWDQLVNRVSQKKMLELVRMGGHSTIALKAIDLPATQDKYGSSGISGTLVGGISCMAWPVEVMMAATWNDHLIEEMGVIVSDSIKPWRTWITIADVAIWTLSATGIGIVVALLI